MYGLSDPLTAFYFDRAVYTFGIHVEVEMDESTEKLKKPRTETIKRKRMAVLDKWIGSTPSEQAKRFKDPAKPTTRL